MFNKRKNTLDISEKGKLKKRESSRNQIASTDQYIPEDEKTLVQVKDPDDLPAEDPYENPEEEPPAKGEGP
jgi:hypothetical protein